jgi:hypothetical protein
MLPKYERRVPLFNDQIISMYGFCMSDRDIKAYLEQVYHVEVSPELKRLSDRGRDGRCDRVAQPAAG